MEKLGRNDPCPCGSGRAFQEMLPEIGKLLMAKGEMTISAKMRGLSPIRGQGTD